MNNKELIAILKAYKDGLYDGFEMAKEKCESKILALQNQSESKAIPELSDEEIIKWAYGKQYDPNDENQSSFVEGAIFYREQLKSKQCSATTR